MLSANTRGQHGGSQYTDSWDLFSRKICYCIFTTVEYTNNDLVFSFSYSLAILEINQFKY